MCVYVLRFSEAVHQAVSCNLACAWPWCRDGEHAHRVVISSHRCELHAISHSVSDYLRAGFCKGLNDSLASCDQSFSVCTCRTACAGIRRAFRWAPPRAFVEHLFPRAGICLTMFWGTRAFFEHLWEQFWTSENVVGIFGCVECPRAFGVACVLPAQGRYSRRGQLDGKWNSMGWSIAMGICWGWARRAAREHGRAHLAVAPTQGRASARARISPHACPIGHVLQHGQQPGRRGCGGCGGAG